MRALRQALSVQSETTKQNAKNSRILRQRSLIMIENVLTRNGVSFRMKITVKSLISAGIIALAVILPQLVHLFAGRRAALSGCLCICLC